MNILQGFSGGEIVMRPDRVVDLEIHENGVKEVSLNGQKGWLSISAGQVDELSRQVQVLREPSVSRIVRTAKRKESH